MAEQYLSQVQTQKQTQVMAPQLRQSLEMLQVPIQELQALIAQELEQNPTLEELPLEKEQIELGTEDTGEIDDSEDLELGEDYQKLIKLNEEWSDILNPHGPARSRNYDQEEVNQYYVDSLREDKSLQEHLLEQLGLLDLEAVDRQIAEMIIGSIDEHGYLTTSLENLAGDLGLELEDFEDMLILVQGFDPVGVGARDLRECLLIQLERLGRVGTLEYLIVDKHLKDLGSKRYRELGQRLRISPSDMQQAADMIGSLDPKPGNRFSSQSTAYVYPEIQLYVDRDGAYQISLKEEQIPRLRISRHYMRMLEDPTLNKETKRYIVEKIKSGRFMMDSIIQRQETIRSIAETIVKVQHDFFEYGVSELKPLTMSKVASMIGKHETTVSRAIANKYMQTPRGVFDLKYFFTPGLERVNGTEISNESIKDVIRNLVDNEPAQKPLSDSKLVKALQDQGIKVARRTVAKYREEMNILPSHLRKRV